MRNLKSTSNKKVLILFMLTAVFAIGGCADASSQPTESSEDDGTDSDIDGDSDTDTDTDADADTDTDGDTDADTDSDSDIDTDTKNQIQFCPGSCDKLKVVKEVTAKFGCPPNVP